MDRLADKPVPTKQPISFYGSQSNAQASSGGMAGSSDLPKVENPDVEDRMQRLKNQRDMLRRIKEEERQKELSDFNAKMEKEGVAPKKSIVDDFRAIDAGKGNPISGSSAAASGGSASDLEKRRAIFKNVRKQIDKDEKQAKEEKYQKKVAEMMQKIDKKEAAQKNAGKLGAAATDLN